MPSLNKTEPLQVTMKTLADYYMTDSISRASPTMAQCVEAVKKQQAKDAVRQPTEAEQLYSYN